MYKIEMQMANKEDVERVMAAIGLTPSPFPTLPFSVDGRDGGYIYVEEI